MSLKEKNKKKKKKKLRCVCHQLLLLCVVIKPGKGEIETVSLDAHCFPKKRVISHAADASVEVRSVSRQERQLLSRNSPVLVCSAPSFCSRLQPGLTHAGSREGSPALLPVAVLGVFPGSAQPSPCPGHTGVGAVVVGSFAARVGFGVPMRCR